jgi:hypothetical protein
MKVEIDNDEAWNLMSTVLVQLLDQAPLADADKARVRRWKSDEMRVTSQEMRVLTQKMNSAIQEVMARKTKSQIRKPDWM